MAFGFAADVAILPRVGFLFVVPSRGAFAPALVVWGASSKAAGGRLPGSTGQLNMELLECRGVVDEVR